MKLLFSSLVSISALSALTGAAAQPNTASDPFFTIGAAGGGCIGLKYGTAQHGDRLKLRSCDRADDSTLWTIDQDSRFRSKLDMSKCMQVGVKGSIPTADSPLRMVECGRADELQQFDVSDFMDDMSGLIKVASAPELCVVHHGPGADIDKDIIFLKKCSILGQEERGQGWVANIMFPEEPPQEESMDYFTFGAPGGGCIGLKDGSAARGTPLLLVECSLDDESTQWMKDDEDRFRSKVDNGMCIQNGVTGSTLGGNRTALRVVPCGVSELQIFDISQVNPIDEEAEEGLLTGPITPMNSPELCMVHRGPVAHLGSDPIVLKPCSSLLETGDERSMGWNITFLGPREIDRPEEEEYTYFTFGAPGGGCIGLENRSALRGNRLKLVECSPINVSIQWALDGESRFRSKVDTEKCIQNGVTGSTVKDGTDLRVVPCGVSELQHFDISQVTESMGGASGPITPLGSPELCVVHRGPTANLGSDPIVLKSCSSLLEAGDERSMGWNITFLGPFPVRF